MRSGDACVSVRLRGPITHHRSIPLATRCVSQVPAKVGIRSVNVHYICIALHGPGVERCVAIVIAGTSHALVGRMLRMSIRPRLF
jgi:hypothetical protein